MAKYETMLVTSSALDEEASAALIGKFKSLIEANGTIDSVDDWGKRLSRLPHRRRNRGRLYRDSSSPASRISPQSWIVTTVSPKAFSAALSLPREA